MKLLERLKSGFHLSFFVNGLGKYQPACFYNKDGYVLLPLGHKINVIKNGKSLAFVDDGYSSFGSISIATKRSSEIDGLSFHSIDDDFNQLYGFTLFAFDSIDFDIDTLFDSFETFLVEHHIEVEWRSSAKIVCLSIDKK